mgnify:CR=1 FL=1
MNDQGLPSSDIRNSGSKVNFRPTVKLMMVAGLPKVKMGTTEIPLFVIKVDVANWIGLAVESVGASARLFQLANIKATRQMDFKCMMGFLKRAG